MFDEERTCFEEIFERIDLIGECCRTTYVAIKDHELLTDADGSGLCI